MYHPAEFVENLEYARTPQETKSALRDLPFAYTLLDRTKVKTEAAKSENARKRKRAGKKHLAQGKKKAAKSAKKQAEAGPQSLGLDNLQGS